MEDITRGGQFLIKETKCENVFTPEDFSEEQIMMRDSVKEFVDKEIWPNKDRFEHKDYAFTEAMMRKAGEMGFLSVAVPENHGGMGMGFVDTCLVCDYISGATGSFSTAFGAHTGIGTMPITLYGTEEQKQKYVPKLASGEWFGAYCLTEPGAGSDANSGKTKAVLSDDGTHYKITGQKMWISNAPFADIAIVWAKNEEGRIHGLIVERGMDGFSTPETHNKWSLRASSTGELIFDNVKVPKENLLPNKSGLGAPLGCLDSARYGIAWGAIGAAMDCYDTALRYAKERIQFDKPIAGTQLQQKKLAEMITEITKAQLLTWRLGVLRNEGKATTAQISMAKRNNVDMAINIAREARQMLGGMGITGEYSIMRHSMNLESVITYEGTHDIHALILGRAQTGIAAFAN